MTLLAFLRRHLGARVTAPGGIGGQCVDLVNVYLGEVFLRQPIRADAVDWARLNVPGFSWEPNGPVNHPPPGSIVVWVRSPTHGIGPFGHIALCLNADPMDLLSFDQNWPDGAACSIVLHDYSGVLGWHRLAG